MHTQICLAKYTVTPAGLFRHRYSCLDLSWEFCLHCSCNSRQPGWGPRLQPQQRQPQSNQHLPKVTEFQLVKSSDRASTAVFTSWDWWQRRDAVLMWHTCSQCPKMMSSRPLEKVWAWQKGSIASLLQPSEDVEIIIWPRSLRLSPSPAWQASLSEARI